MLGAVHIKSLVTRLTHLNSPGALPPLSSAEIEAVQRPRHATTCVWRGSPLRLH